MKKCPFCAEEIQEEAIVCKHCGRELVPLQVVPKPIVQASPSVPTNLPLNPALTPVLQAYTQKGYKVVAASGDVATVERPAAQFNNCLLYGLVFLFGVGAIVYVIVYFIWAIRKTYRAQLIVGPDGRVQELGGTLQNFENDRLQANQKRYMGFGVLLCSLGLIIAFLALMALIGGLMDQTSPWYQSILYSLMFLIFGNLPTGLLGAFLIWQSKKIKQKLNLQDHAATLQTA